MLDREEVPAREEVVAREEDQREVLAREQELFRWLSVVPGETLEAECPG